MLEAMGAGKPVVAAGRPYAREICEPAGGFFDPDSPDDLFLRLEEVLGAHVSGKALSRYASAALERYPDARGHAAQWVTLLQNVQSQVSDRMSKTS